MELGSSRTLTGQLIRREVQRLHVRQLSKGLWNYIWIKSHGKHPLYWTIKHSSGVFYEDCACKMENETHFPWKLPVLNGLVSTNKERLLPSGTQTLHFCNLGKHIISHIQRHILDIAGDQRVHVVQNPSRRIVKRFCVAWLPHKYLATLNGICPGYLTSGSTTS